ncbi:MAG: DUF4129 domain-containing protein [Anaerolineae bacterium]|jgi:hypothetical protein
MSEHGSASPGQQVSGNSFVENLMRPVLIAAMEVCLATPAVLGVEWLIGGWDGTYFLIFTFLAALEGILSERMLHARRITGWPYLVSRGAEVLILLLTLKLVNYIPGGVNQLWLDAQTWFSDPTQLLQTPGLLVSAVDMFTGTLFVPLWAGALYVARQAAELDVKGGRVAPPPDKTSTEYYLWLTQPPLVRDREAALTWLGETFMWGGVWLLFASMIIHFLSPAAKLLAIPTLLYFALGVALLGQARFSVTHTGWLLQGIPVQPEIARRWLVWAVIFLVSVALVASLLPTEYAMGPVLAIHRLILIATEVILLIVTFITYLFVLLLSLFLPSIDAPADPLLSLPSATAPEPTPPSSSLPWLEVLLSALFWMVILSIVGYALYRFVRDRFDLLGTGEEEGEGNWWQRILTWLRDLWQRWWTWRWGMQARLVRRLVARLADGPKSMQLSRFFSLGRLSPRELIHYFYLSTVHRAAQAGLPRRPGQTPYEYQTALDERFPDLERDLNGLTEAFVEARYSRRPVQEKDAKAVKPLWQRIKAALRRRRFGNQQSDDHD